MLLIWQAVETSKNYYMRSIFACERKYIGEYERNGRAMSAFEHIVAQKNQTCFLGQKLLCGEHGNLLIGKGSMVKLPAVFFWSAAVLLPE